MEGDVKTNGSQELAQGKKDIPIVQFSAPVMYADEGEVSQVEVMRIGALDETCVVRYMPLGVGAELEGQKFHPCRGELEFGPGEHTKAFDLRLVDEKSFDSVVELPFKLEAVSNCEVGVYNSRTLIKIIDDDVFPSAKYKEETILDPTCDSWKHGRDWQMLWEIVKLCFSINRRGAIKTLIGDLIINLIFVVQLELNKRLINELSETGRGNNLFGADPFIIVVLIGMLLSVPYAFDHWFSYRKQFWKVGGMVRKEMLTDLMTRILYYRESTRDTVYAQEVKETFTHHVFMVVSDGYMQIFPAFASLTRIILILAYFVYTAAYSSAYEQKHHQFLFIICFAVVPVVAGGYMRLRARVNNKVREETEDAHIALANYAAGVVDNYRMVADCWARPIVMAKCNEMIGKVNRCLVDQGATQANDIAFFRWASEFVEASTIIMGGFLVLKYDMSLGAFTSTLAGLRSATAQYSAMYQSALKMQSIFPGQWLLCQYMNLPMDLDERDENADRQRKFWQPSLEQAREHERVRAGEQIAEDMIPLQLKDVCFEFPHSMKELFCKSQTGIVRAQFPEPGGGVLTPASQGGEPDSEPHPGPLHDKLLLNKINLSIEQGKLVGITGPPGEGKGTLLRILADVLLPTSGTVFVPTHLLVHHVELQDHLYDASIAENVFLALMARRGVTGIEGLDRGEIDRGVAVCRALEMTEHIVAAVEHPFRNKGKSLKGLSKTTRIRLQLARALIANPEVLVLHLPVDLLNHDQCEVIIHQLKDFVTKKGVFMDPEQFSQRRPRTCIFTSNQQHVLDRADEIYWVEKGQVSRKLAEGAGSKEDDNAREDSPSAASDAGSLASTIPQRKWRSRANRQTAV